MAVSAPDARVDGEDVFEDGVGGWHDGCAARGGGDAEGGGEVEVVVCCCCEHERAEDCDEGGGGGCAEANEWVVRGCAYDELALRIHYQ